MLALHHLHSPLKLVDDRPRLSLKIKGFCSPSRASAPSIRDANTKICEKRAVTVHVGAAQELPLRSMFPVSVDPMLQGQCSQVYTAGKIFTIHSEDELNSLLSVHNDKLVILMCKASHCRPCKMFTRKYMRLAEKFKNTVFLDIIGDEDADTKRMMISLGIKVTPTFRIYKNGAYLLSLTGTSENKLCKVVIENFDPNSASLDSFTTLCESPAEGS